MELTLSSDGRIVFSPLRVIHDYSQWVVPEQAFSDIRAKRIQNRTVKPLNLAVRLGMVRGRKYLRNPQFPAHFHEELRSELRSIITQQIARWTIGKYSMGAERLCNRERCSRPQRNGPSQLGKAIRDH
jgi:hypothetical protein